MIIGIHTAVFIYQVQLSSPESVQFIQRYGMTPVQLWENNEVFQLLTSIFLHGGWFHFLSNMWMLAIFGDHVEDQLGKARYGILYIAGGLTAGLVQGIMVSNSPIPTIGASGAIAGVLGSYILLAPKAKVLTLVPVGFFAPWLIHVPALFYLGFWFISQVYAGVNTLNTPGNGLRGGTAWWAHIGGFLLGAVFIFLFARSKIRLPIEKELSELDDEPFGTYYPVQLQDKGTQMDDLEEDTSMDWASWEMMDADDSNQDEGD